MKKAAWFVVPLAVLASGCASVQSHNASGGGVGIAYMTPMRLLTLTATRAPALDDVTQGEVDRLREAYTTASSEATDQAHAVDTLITQAATLRAAVAAAADAGKAAAETAAAAKERERDAAAALLVQKQTRQHDAEQAYLTRLRVALANVRQWSETVQVAMGPAVGDPSHRFAADLNSSPFRSDRGKIVVGANSLLQSADLTMEGHVGDVILGVTEAIVSIAGAGGRVHADAPPPSEANSPAPQCNGDGQLTSGFENKSPVRQTLTLTFDPTRPDEVRTVNVALCRLAFSYRLAPPQQASPQPSSGFRSQATFQQQAANGLECVRPGADCPGLVYRQSEPFTLQVQRINTLCGWSGNVWVDNFRPAAAPPPSPPPPSPPAPPAAREACEPYTVQTLNFSIPNAAPLDVIPYSTAFFVSRHDTVAFVDGSLASVDFDHPSEAAVAARIPGQILTTISSSIASVLQLRIDLSNKQASLAQAEQQLAETRVADPSAENVTRLQNLKTVLQLQADIAHLQQQLRDAENAAPPSAATP